VHLQGSRACGLFVLELVISRGSRAQREAAELSSLRALRMSLRRCSIQVNTRNRRCGG
jgi:hypothetical protein